MSSDSDPWLVHDNQGDISVDVDYFGSTSDGPVCTYRVRSHPQNLDPPGLPILEKNRGPLHSPVYRRVDDIDDIDAITMLRAKASL